jgi:hypothetical protein
LWVFQESLSSDSRFLHFSGTFPDRDITSQPLPFRHFWPINGKVPAKSLPGGKQGLRTTCGTWLT